MDRKWLVTSPFTGEILALSDEEARRLVRSAGDALADLAAAAAEASRTGRDEPVGLPEADGSRWLVCAH